MKKLVNFKKVAAAAMAGTMIFAVTACGSKEDPAASAAPSEQVSEAPKAEIAKPEKIVAVIDTVFGSQLDTNSFTPFVEKYKELQGIDIEFTKPAHAEYYQQLSLLFTTGNIPDVAELGAVYYPTYANNGALWNMSDAWANSDLKASGIVDEKYVDALVVNDGLYGFPFAKGNGTVTYLRQDWLDNLGLSTPTNFAEFSDMLDKFTNADPDGNGKNDTYGITIAGLVGNEAPYAMYQREYYQDAIPDFYQKEDGTWVDGMTEPNMVEALQRMRDHFQAGYMDQEVVTNKTSTAREKFYAGQFGAFNYWAGNWNVTIQNNLSAQTPTGVAVAIPAIAETYYIDRPPTALVITSAAQNPEGIFKYLVEYSHDGGEGQLLFTRGVEGVNYTVENGVYTQLPDVENEKKLYEKSWYSPELSITKFDDPIGFDPLLESSLAIFEADSVIAPVPTVNDVIAAEQPDLLPIRNLAIAEAVTGTGTVEEALAKYSQDGKSKIDAILASLNK